jgi:hypothetical protein
VVDEFDLLVGVDADGAVADVASGPPPDGDVLAADGLSGPPLGDKAVVVD